MKVVAIIQARMTSTRLPGKVLMQVQGKSLLEYQLERVKRSKFIDEIVVATTVNTSDDPIVKLCDKVGVSIYRGSEEDVLSRYYEAAMQFEADVIVRLTSDCPLIDPKIIDRVIQKYLENEFDYVSNTQKRTFPRGMDTEVFTATLLKQANDKASKDYEREHVTPYFYLNSKTFSIGHVTDKRNNSQYRLTVDTLEDFNLITLIIENLYFKNEHFELNEIMIFLEEHPEFVQINSHIKQKRLGE